jgi:DNA-binding NarL/FixJ family response regulator/anti-sigma regulatory factor (Ser/Thr protein kinase)
MGPVKPVKVILVDDEPIVISDLQTLVDWEALGFSIVGCAYSSEQALALVRRHGPGLAFVDVALPGGINGLELSARIKAISPGTIVIILSSFMDFAYAQQAIDVGVFTYLVKHQLTQQSLTGILNKAKVKLHQREAESALVRQQLLKALLSGGALYAALPLVDAKGRVLYAQGPAGFALLAPQLEEGQQSLEDHYYFTNRVEKVDWRIISGLHPHQARQAVGFPYLFIGLVIFASLGLLFVFVPRRYMAEALNSLQECQRLQFELLLAKINPHFIYNTLNSIIYLARGKKNHEIIDLTSAFIDLLQDSIHLGQNTPYERLETELDVIDKYVTVQQYQYMGRFLFTRECDPGLQGTFILKNILQPLVENAIFHGIGPKEGAGSIHLRVSRQGETLRVAVSDDGVGMEQGTADRCLRAQRGEAPRGSPKIRHIGLDNIAQRLEFAFPGRHGFSITSSPGVGTTVVITHPVAYEPRAGAV